MLKTLRYKRRDGDGIVHYLDTEVYKRPRQPRFRVGRCGVSLVVSSPVSINEKIWCIGCIASETTCRE